MCCSVLQCVAVCCRVLQGVAGCCRVLQCLAVQWCGAGLDMLDVWRSKACAACIGGHSSWLQCVAAIGIGQQCVVGLGTGWQRSIGCLTLQVIFRRRATNYRALLRKMTQKDKASYGSSPPCSLDIAAV